jgi:hypothetical protein
MYKQVDILNIISPMAVSICFSKMWKIYPVFHVLLTELFIKGNTDIDSKDVLKTCDPIENAPKSDVNIVMGSIEQDDTVLYLVRYKDYSGKKYWIGEPSTIIIE